MYKQVLSKLYSLNLMVIEKNLADISHEESLKSPQPQGNCINWVLGHITATRNDVMELMNDRPVWSEEVAAAYIRGAKPLANGDDAMQLGEIMKDLKSAHERFSDRLMYMPEEEFKASINGTTRLEHLSVLQFHEAYHAGQLGILRRLIGKPGAIR